MELYLICLTVLIVAYWIKTTIIKINSTKNLMTNNRQWERKLNSKTKLDKRLIKLEERFSELSRLSKVNLNYNSQINKRIDETNNYVLNCQKQVDELNSKIFDNSKLEEHLKEYEQFKFKILNRK